MAANLQGERVTGLRFWKEHVEQLENRPFRKVGGVPSVHSDLRTPGSKGNTKA